MMVRRHIVIPLVIVVVGLLAGGSYFLLQPKREPGTSEQAAGHPSTASSTVPPPTPPIKPDSSRIAMRPPKAEELAPVSPHPMAGAIGSPSVAPEKEIKLVMEFLQIYRREFGAFPAGQSNAHFMNALRGANPGKLPIFPMNHPRLDTAGNLLDPWQESYLFHPVSRDRLEIRSKGPDRTAYTADDLMAPK